MNEKVLLSTAYLPPIQYFTKILKYDDILIEAHENFIKQTYRNRCNIYGANGMISLTIPVKRNVSKIVIKDLLIDYSTNWRKLHWKSIESAYNSSPFFEYYADDYFPFYQKEYKYLLDYNCDIQEIVMDNLGIIKKLNFTNEYQFPKGLLIDDFREKIQPKKSFQDYDFKIQKYNQVFIDKHGFIPNLSILDLIFNEGPNAINFI